MATAKKTKTKTEQTALYFSTGCTLLDAVTGGGEGMGFPEGIVINIVGDKSSGKTFLACEIVASASHTYGKRLKWVYDDCESGFTFNTERLYGVEIIPENPEDRIRSKTVEEMSVNVRNFVQSLKPEEIGIYIVDSLDGLSNKDTEERAKERQTAHNKGKTFEKGSYGMATAKFLSQEFFRTLVEPIERARVLFVIISQTRDKIDSMFKEQTRGGGKALDFFCHTVLWLAGLQKIEKKERAVGYVVHAKAKKSKTPRPYRECIFNFLFDYGLDDVGSNIDFLFDLRTERGKLAAKPIQWVSPENVKEPTIGNLITWLEEIGEEDRARAAITESTGRPTLKKSEVLEWCMKQDKAFRAKFSETFGASMTRDEAIVYVEENGLQKELRERVILKWEDLEASIRTNRKGKYET
jgi:recombination protein RecA